MIATRLVSGVCLTLCLGACASSTPEKDFEMSVADGALDLAVSRNLVVSMLSESLDTDLECDGELDGDLRRLLEPLAHDSRGKTSVNHDGDRIIAYRRGSRLKFKIINDDGGRLEATMPWAVGECLLGNRTSLEQALGSSPIEVTLVTDEGRRLTARLS